MSMLPTPDDGANDLPWISPTCPRCGQTRHDNPGVPFIVQPTPIPLHDGTFLKMKRWFLCPVTGEPVIIMALAILVRR